MVRYGQIDFLRDSMGTPGDRLVHERRVWQDGFRRVAGIDEAGRGPLAGPVVAAAVVLDPEQLIDRLDDSKRLTSRQRDFLFDEIRRKALAVGVGIVGTESIERLNILNATLKAMLCAVERVTPPPDFLLVDGIVGVPGWQSQKTVVGGDRLSLSVAAASIVAKVVRDRKMDYYHKVYPHYNFQGNKGYGTKEHREAIARFGCCPIHRKTFRGVKEYINIPPLFFGNLIPRLQSKEFQLPMDARKQLGNESEQIAAEYLRKHGVETIARNYRCRFGEIDIVGKEGGCLVFVEVRSGKEGSFVHPKHSIGPKKRKTLYVTALCFLKERGLIDSRSRFDVLTIVYSKGKPMVEWTKNAFSAQG